MYKILGVDGKEYGPATAEAVIQWIHEGRATAATHVKLGTAAEWKPLSDFPEFATALGAKAAAGPPPLTGAPPLAGGDSAILAGQILARGYGISPGHCIERSWGLLKRHFWLLLGATFVVHIIRGVPLVGWLLSGVLTGGLFFLYLRLIRGQTAEFSDAFHGFNQSFLQLFLAGIVTSLLTGVGFALCVIPGIYLAVAWLLAEPLVIDRNLEFWPAMELSRKVISAHWWEFFGLALLCFLLLLAGCLVCCVGVFVAMPVVIGALAYAYEDLFGASTGPPPQQI